MAVVIKRPKMAEAVTFDKLHIDSFNLVQIPPTNMHDAIVRMVKIQGTTYHEREDGTTVLSNHPVRANIMDLDPVIIGTYCVQHKKPLEHALKDLAEARSKVSSDYKEGLITDLHLMAAFELAIGRILELSGSIEVDRLE